MDERELEQTLRAGLAAHAEEADTTAPVAARVRADVGRRRRTRWGAVAVAAAVVVVAGGVAVATVGDRDTATPTVGETPAIDDADGWRTEYWADVAVDVPADWGYGGAPSDERGRIACYPAPMVTADGRWLDQLPSDTEVAGYVGRPVMLTDDCAGYGAGVPFESSGPFVWLGAAVPPGVVERDGFVQETVEVDGTTVTVGTADDALRERILSSVRGGEMCMSELPRLGEIAHDRPSSSGTTPVSLRVCAYSAAEDGDSVELTYAADLGGEALADYQEALDGAARGWVDGCPTLDYAGNTWVVLEVVDAQGAVLRQDVVSTQCGLSVTTGADRLSGERGQPFELSAALVEPWADGGIAATVPGYVLTPANYWVYDYFIGPLG